MRSNRNLVWAAVGVAVFALGLVRHVAAGSSFERTHALTFSQPVRLPRVALGARALTSSRLADLNWRRTWCASSAAIGGPCISWSFTNAAERPRGLSPDAAVSLGESAAGVAPRITAWWPIGREVRPSVHLPDR